MHSDFGGIWEATVSASETRIVGPLLGQLIRDVLHSAPVSFPLDMLACDCWLKSQQHLHAKAPHHVGRPETDCKPSYTGVASLMISHPAELTASLESRITATLAISAGSSMYMLEASSFGDSINGFFKCRTLCVHPFPSFDLIARQHPPAVHYTFQPFSLDDCRHQCCRPCSFHVPQVNSF